MGDEDLLRRAEEALAEINRNQGLSDENASVLAAIRIRLEGAARKTLDEVLDAAGDLSGKRTLEDLQPPKQDGSLEELFGTPEKKKDWPD
ncbi:MAG: hypothetical protein ABR507_08810 [Actinomycetota bacterium]|nr:hypothetical protein [Actinomycetota bacterium]